MTYRYKVLVAILFFSLLLSLSSCSFFGGDESSVTSQPSQSGTTSERSKSGEGSESGENSGEDSESSDILPVSAEVIKEYILPHSNCEFIEEKTNKFYNYEVYSDHIVITKFKNNAINVDIPSEIDGLPVVEIGDYAFNKGEKVASLTIPEGIIKIGDFAFKGCVNISSAILPESLIFLGSGVFEGCKRLLNVSVPKGLKIAGASAFSETPWFNKLDDEFCFIGDGVLIKYNGDNENVVLPDNVKCVSAFFKNRSIVSVELPQNCVYIGSYCFYGCRRLSSINLSQNVAFIGSYAFVDCKSVAISELSENLLSIGSYAFSNCLNVKDIFIPKTVNYIGEYVFYLAQLNNITVEEGSLSYVDIDGVLYSYDRSSLIHYPSEKENTSYIIPSSVRRIENGAFYRAANLKEVTIGVSVSYIGSEAFSICRGLTEIVLPSEVKVIGEKAFSDCPYLSKVTIGGGVEVIGSLAFDACTKLKTIEYEGSASDWSEIEIAQNNDKLLIVEFMKD